jgi:uncharacterized alkaline shock family protein YloU
MTDNKPKKDTSRQVNIKRIDTKEFELPETLFVSDIDTKVFQGIALQCLSQIEGIALVEGNFIDSIFGRSSPEVGGGIQSEQDTKNHSVSIKIEVNIQYGLSIPQKAEEIQSKIVEEITRLTGLRVAAVHVVFKNIIPLASTQSTINYLDNAFKQQSKAGSESEYNDEF